MATVQTDLYRGHHLQPINPGDMGDADSITGPGDSPIGATGVMHPVLHVLSRRMKTEVV